MTVNLCVLSGTIAERPQLSRLRSGESVCNVTVLDGLNRFRVAFYKDAYRAANLPPGAFVVVEAFLKMSSWNRDGRAHSELCLVGQRVVDVDKPVESESVPGV
jgi:single-stranded DNA-binding protein